MTFEHWEYHQAASELIDRVRGRELEVDESCLKDPELMRNFDLHLEMVFTISKHLADGRMVVLIEDGSGGCEMRVYE